MIIILLIGYLIIKINIKFLVEYIICLGIFGKKINVYFFQIKKLLSIKMYYSLIERRYRMDY